MRSESPRALLLRLREKQDNVLMPFLNGSLVGKADDSSSKLNSFFAEGLGVTTDQEISPNEIV
jgi:hypothetical protein